MLTRLRNLFKSDNTTTPTLQPARRATLGLESLEMREVPAVLGAAGAYTVFGLGNTDIDLVGRAVDQGSVAVGRGGSVDVLNRAVVSGTVSLDRNTGFRDPGASSVGSVQRRVDLSGAAADALNGSAALAAMTPTQSIRSITDSRVIVGNGGVNVINVNVINLNNADRLTLRGGANDYFYVNVTGRLDLAGRSAVVLTGGVTANHVIFNVIGRGNDVNITGNSVLRGTLLVPNRDVSLSGDVYGSIIGAQGHDIRLVSNAHVYSARFQEPVASTNTAVITGSVHYTLNNGEQSGPVNGATITLMDEDENILAQTGTGTTGTYTLDHLPAGTYILLIESDFGSEVREITLTNGQTLTQNFNFNS